MVRYRFSIAKSAWPYSTGAPPATSTSRNTPSIGASTSVIAPSDCTAPSTVPFFTASPALHSFDALKIPTPAECTFAGSGALGAAARAASVACAATTDGTRTIAAAMPSASTSMTLAPDPSASRHRDEAIDDAELQQVARGEFQRVRGLLGLRRAPPEDRGRAFR